MLMVVILMYGAHASDNGTWSDGDSSNHYGHEKMVTIMFTMTGCLVLLLLNYCQLKTRPTINSN